MSDKRLVECQDCGYRWESSASSPRCSQSDCGRSRNVEPVGTDDLDDEPDDLDDEPDDLDDEPDDLDDEPDPDPADDTSTDDSGGFTPAFESVNQTAEVDPTPSTPSTSTDDDSEDSTDDDSEDSTDEGADPADEVPELDPEQVAAVLDVTFDMVADRRGEHWELRDGEDEKLAQAWTPVANSYAPVLFREHSEVGLAVVCTVSILAPKLAEDRRRAKRREQRERERENGTPGEVREPTENGSTSWTPPEEQTDEQTEQWVDESPQTAAAAAGGYDNV